MVSKNQSIQDLKLSLKFFLPYNRLSENLMQVKMSNPREI